MKDPITITRIEEVSPGFAAAIERLLPQLGDLRPPTQAELAQMLAAPNLVQFAAAHADFGAQIIGLASLVIYRVPSGLHGYIEDVVVDELARGRGVGRALVLACLDHARAAGAPQVDLTSNPARAAANRLYQAMGFEQRRTNVYRYHFQDPLAGDKKA